VAVARTSSAAGRLAILGIGLAGLLTLAAGVFATSAFDGGAHAATPTTAPNETTVPATAPPTTAAVPTTGPPTTATPPTPTTTSTPTKTPGTTVPVAPVPTTFDVVIPPQTFPVTTVPYITTPTSSTTSTTIAPLGGHVPASPSTVPLTTKGTSAHVSPFFAILSGAGFLVAILIVSGRFISTRPRRRV
jgi:hypothetical protein